MQVCILFEDIIKWTKTKYETCLTGPEHELLKQMNGSGFIARMGPWAALYATLVLSYVMKGEKSLQKAVVFYSAHDIFFHIATMQSKIDICLWAFYDQWDSLKHVCIFVLCSLLGCCPRWWQTVMAVMEVTFSTSFSFRMAASFTTFLCWASTQKTETLDTVKLFLWKGNTAAQSGFEFMRWIFFLLLDGSSHHLFSTPLTSGVNCCSLWHQHIFIICQMWLWWLSLCLWLGLIVVCVSRLFIF